MDETEYWDIISSNFTNEDYTTFSANVSAIGFENKIKVLRRYLVPTLCTLITVAGFIGNGLVVLALSLSRYMRQNSTYMLILNLAVVDLLFIAVCVPVSGVYQVNNFWPFGEAACKIVFYVIAVTYSVSIYSLVFMSAERLLVVRYPLSNRRKMYLVLIPVMWVVFLVLNAYAVVRHEVVVAQVYMRQKDTWDIWKIEKRPICILRFTTFEGQQAYWIMYFLMSYLLPLVAIGGVYVALVWYMWHRYAAQDPRQRSRMKLVTINVVAIVAVFAICWLPYYVIGLMLAVGQRVFSYFDIL